MEEKEGDDNNRYIANLLRGLVLECATTLPLPLHWLAHIGH